MEETTSVFWVDLGYRLRSRKKVPLQGSRGVTGTRPVPVLVPVMHVIHVPGLLYMLPNYLAIGPGSVPGVWAVIPGMYGTHLKHRQHLQPISFIDLESQLTCVVDTV